MTFWNLIPAEILDQLKVALASLTLSLVGLPVYSSQY